MECSRLRSRWFRAMAVTELAQQDVSRTDYRAHFRLDTYRPAALFSTPSRPFRRGFGAFQPIFEILRAPRAIRIGTHWATIDRCACTSPGAALGPPYREGGKPGLAADGSTLPWARSRRPAGLWRMVGEPGAASGLRYPENHLVRLGI